MASVRPANGLRGRAGSFGTAARGALARSRKILANTGWMLAERVVQLAAGVLVGIWIARYLGPEQFGQLNYSVAFVALFLPLFSFGLNHIVTRELLKEPDKEGEILGTAYALRLTTSLLTFGLISFVTLYMHDEQTRLYIMIVAFASLFDTFAVLQYWFNARLAYRWITVANSTALLLCSAVRIVLILVEAPLVWFVVATASDVALGGLFGLWAYLHLGNRLELARDACAREAAALLLLATDLLEHAGDDQPEDRSGHDRRHAGRSRGRHLRDGGEAVRDLVLRAGRDRGVGDAQPDCQPRAFGSGIRPAASALARHPGDRRLRSRHLCGGLPIRSSASSTVRNTPRRA